MFHRNGINVIYSDYEPVPYPQQVKGEFVPNLSVIDFIMNNGYDFDRYYEGGDRVKDASFGIYIPSYKRAKTCITHKWLDNYRYVVRKSEEKDYIAAGIPPENILAVHDNQINGMVKVNQWLIDNAKEEIICILDDDIRRMVYRLDKAVDIPGP